MCGIAGVSLSRPAERCGDLLRSMSARLAHRGPDDDGIFVSPDQTAGLAHRRLSILDLSSRGHQPMASASGKLSLSYNGEIYNYPELRGQLEAKGRRFSSDCDTEVILHLYEELGEGCVERLHGMFAFALYDSEARTLFCARDRLGKKPLVYGAFAGGVAVASEIPALFELPGVDLTPSEEAIALYLLRNLRHIPDPWTLYRGIHRLPPGHVMTVKDGEVTSVRRYWTPTLEAREVDQVELLATFDRAVEMRLLSDVEIGVLLSGGVDSSAIADSLRRQGHQNLRSYAFGLDENDEEIQRARRASALLGTRHSEVYFEPDKQHDHFLEILRQHGEPIMALPLTHAFSLFQRIKDDGLKVVLAGHGADEIFFGYPGFNGMALLSDLIELLPARLAQAAAWTASRLVRRGRVREAALAVLAPAGHRKSALYVDEAARLWPVLFGPKRAARLAAGLVERWLDTWADRLGSASFIDESAFLGLMQENSHATTTAGDLPAMAHGIEMRCPFLDQSLVELALQIPYRQKVPALRGDERNKLILKRALSGRLPKDLLYAKKRGFGYFVSEERVLRGAWKQNVDRAFAAFPAANQGVDPKAVSALKSRFDSHGDVPSSLIAKLYALRMAAGMAAGVAAGVAEGVPEGACSTS